MIELQDNRVLGAIRWIDAVTQAPITLPLTVSSETLRFTRNHSGLAVITFAEGLERTLTVFDLADLAPADVVPPGSLAREAVVVDPSGTYLPARFTIDLPRNPSAAVLPPNNQRPPNSLFTPIDIPLLPSPKARLAPGCAQVRVLIEDDEGEPIPHALARVVATSDDAILGCGLADHRGEALVAIPGLKHFAPGATPEEVVSVETTARLEIIHPPANTETDAVNWVALRAATVADGDTDPEPLRLRPGALFSRRYPFTS